MEIETGDSVLNWDKEIRRTRRFGGEERASDSASLNLRGMGFIQGQMYRFQEGTWDLLLENRSSHEKTMEVISTGRVEMLEWMRPCS